MIFKFIFIIIISSTFSYGDNFFDRFYAFGEWNKETNFEKKVRDYNNLVGGFLISKKINFSAGENIYFSYYLKSSENTDGNNSLDSIIREFYFTTHIMGVVADIGKKIIDLSVSKIYSINTFLSPLTSILAPYDKSLDIYGLEGITLKQNFDFFNTNGFLYIYQKEIFSSIENEEFRIIFNLNHKNQISDNDLFIGIDKDGDFILAGGFSFLINENSNLYTEIKHKNSNFSYILGFDYIAPNGIAVAIERIVKNSQNNTFIRDANTTNTSQINTINNLEDENYIGLYARFPFTAQMTYSALGLSNMQDESKMLVFQGEYKINGLKVFAQYIKNMGHNNSEFGVKSENIFQISLSVDILKNNL